MGSSSAKPLKPTLVCMSWRGGPRLHRCLDSIARSRDYFDRCVVSITGPVDGDDMHIASEFQGVIRGLEVICTQRELPTMQHQAFWVDYLERSGGRPSDWIYWLSYDDEVRPRGIQEITDEFGNWPLRQGTTYFGPWALRHESGDELWKVDADPTLESWTSFPQDGPTRLRVESWIRDQLVQPTYMQMTGSVAPLMSFIRLRDGFPRKKGPMRIEMAIAADPETRFIEEFPTPVAIIYGRPDSDRASYGSSARLEDLHLGTALVRYSVRNPQAIPTFVAGGVQILRNRVRRRGPGEDWRVRDHVLA